MPQYALAEESTTPNESCVNAIDPSGNVYFFSTSSGKTWKRTTAGAYSLVNTNANGAHRGARYFNGYVFYWTATKLGHFNLASTWTDTFATFTIGNARGSLEHANALYIADGRDLARVDSSNTFSGNEFVVPAQYKITDLKSVGDDILVGTYVSTDVAYCKVFLWDTVSASWTYEDEVYEVGVNCFLQIDNVVIAQCGVNGAFYYWTGSQMNSFGRISGITTALGEQMATNFNGKPLFANASKIYSIHRADKDLPIVFCGEYTSSGTIASLAVQGQTLLVSAGTKIEKNSTTAFSTATIETPEVQFPVSEVIVRYDVYPEGVGIEVNTNGEGYSNKTEVIDTEKREIYYDGGMSAHSVCQARITLTPSGSNRPKIKGIVFR